MSYRVMLAIGIVLLDLVIVVVPLSAVVWAWVLIANPPWFQNLARQLNGPADTI